MPRKESGKKPKNTRAVACPRAFVHLVDAKCLKSALMVPLAQKILIAASRHISIKERIEEFALHAREWLDP